MLPAKDEISICFAHVAYRLHERFSALDSGIGSFAVRDPETLAKRVGEADVLVISGLWQNSLLDRAKKLRFIQSIGAGTDQFPRDELAKRGIRLASARGVNARAVAEHAIALILALSRRLPEARDNQAKRVWRGMIGDLAAARGRARRQDAAGRRSGRYRRPPRPARQGLRHAGHRAAARSGRRPRRGGCGAPDGRAQAALARGRFRRADLSADQGDREPDRRRGARPDEALRLSRQCRARPGRRRGGADRGAGRAAHRRRRPRCDGGRAAGAELRRSGAWRMC